MNNHLPIGFTLPIDGGRPDLGMNVFHSICQAFNGPVEFYTQDTLSPQGLCSPIYFSEVRTPGDMGLSPLYLPPRSLYSAWSIA